MRWSKKINSAVDSDTLVEQSCSLRSVAITDSTRHAIQLTRCMQRCTYW